MYLEKSKSNISSQRKLEAQESNTKGVQSITQVLMRGITSLNRTIELYNDKLTTLDSAVVYILERSKQSRLNQLSYSY